MDPLLDLSHAPCLSACCTHLWRALPAVQTAYMTSADVLLSCAGLGYCLDTAFVSGLLELDDVNRVVRCFFCVTFVRRLTMCVKGTSWLCSRSAWHCIIISSFFSVCVRARARVPNTCVGSSESP